MSKDMKYDGGKPMVDLIIDGMPEAVLEVAKVLTFGAQKYKAHSWQTLENGSTRYKAALMRHLLAHAAGETDDPESGLSHLAHVACNALFMLQLDLNVQKEVEPEDKPAKKPEARSPIDVKFIGGLNECCKARFTMGKVYKTSPVFRNGSRYIVADDRGVKWTLQSTMTPGNFGLNKTVTSFVDVAVVKEPEAELDLELEPLKITLYYIGDSCPGFKYEAKYVAEWSDARSCYGVRDDDGDEWDLHRVDAFGGFSFGDDGEAVFKEIL